MRILYLHQHFSTPDGSTGTRSYEFARKLVQRGHEVTLICGSYFGGNTGLKGPMERGCRVGFVNGIKVIEIDLPYSNHDSFLKRTRIFFLFVLRSVITAWSESCDLVFATSTPLTIAIPAIIIRLIKRKPFVFEVRDLWPELPREMGVVKNPVVLAGLSALEWVSYRCAVSCIGLSPGIVEGINRRSPSKCKIFMIPNACDLELFKPRNRKLSIPKSGFSVVFTGAHGIANGLGAALDVAVVLLQRGRADIKMVFIGDGKLKPELIERAKNENLENCVFWDPMPKRKLSELLPGFDAGLVLLANVPAFYYGTSPNKFFDYISCGLPIINNYPGWLADMIMENKCGIAVPPDNAELFADALVYMADNPSGVRIMGENSRRLALSSFDREKLANEFVDFLENSEKRREKR